MSDISSQYLGWPDILYCQTYPIAVTFSGQLSFTVVNDMVARNAGKGKTPKLQCESAVRIRYRARAGEVPFLKGVALDPILAMG